MTAKLVLATRNAHKVAELRAILADADPRLSADLLIETVVGIERFEVADVVESGVTFEANALLKARAAAQATGLPAVADDSGLCVHALGGAPGVYSARYAGEPKSDERNNQKLVADLAGQSVTTFSRYFRKHTGMSFVQHVNTLRIHRACELLVDTGLSVADICFRVGYNNVSNFNRHFLAQKGVPPSRFRSLHQMNIVSASAVA